MKRILIMTMTLVLGAIACGDKQETSGTNTNWLQACTSPPDCQGYGSCICGLCTNGCSANSDCASGICGSELASTAQCGEGGSRICLPEPVDGGSCTELPLPTVTELGPASPPLCGVPGALLCQSFDAPLPPEYATWYNGTLSASIQDCLVHQGRGALRYRTASFGYSQTRMRLPAPVSSGPLYVRFYAYVPSGFTIPRYLAMFELWCQDASEEGKISIEAIGEDTLEVYLSPGQSGHPGPARSLLRDQWMCLELALDVAASGGSMSLSVNGSRVIEQSGVVTLPPTPISVAVIEGLPSSDAAGADLAVDDLVIATQPIGCP